MVPLSRASAGDLSLLLQLVAGDMLLSLYLALTEAEAARGSPRRSHRRPGPGRDLPSGGVTDITPDSLWPTSIAALS